MSTEYRINTFFITGIESQRKSTTGTETLKRKPDILLIMLPDAINLKCLYSATQISQKFTLLHEIRKHERTPTNFYIWVIWCTFSCKLKGDVFKMKNKNFNKYRSSHADIFAELLAEIFAGNGKNIHAIGLALEYSFWKPCGIAVEFDSAVYITDIDTNSVNVTIPLINTAEILEYVGSLYKDVSIHNKGDRYELQKVKDAANIVNNFENYLSTL